MTTLVQVRQEQQVTKEAYESGKISKSQYSEFMIYSKAQEQQLINEQNAKAKQTSQTAAPLTPPKQEGNWKPVTPETATSTTQKEILVEQKQKAEAINFYTEIGQPKLAEKYTAPVIPKDQKVVGVKEVIPTQVYGVTYGTKDNPNPKAPYLEVTTAPKEPPKGIGETIASINPFDAGLRAAETLLGRQFTREQETKLRSMLSPIMEVSGIPGVEGTPTEVLGNLVSTVEAPIYQIGTAWGVKGLPQPKTTTGAIISSVLEGKPSEEWKAMEKQSPAAQVGSFMGDLLLIVGGGKVTEKIIETTAKLAPVIASSGIKGVAARTALSAGLGGTAAGVLSGGDVEAIAEGALLGAGASLAVEGGVRAVNAIRGKLPEKLGGYPRLTEREGSYVSEPIEGLGGRRLEVVPDTTKNPILSDKDLARFADETIGQKIPTAHATLTPENFALEKGGSTVLKGYPEMTKGFRKEQELFHFYSAPGDEEFVTVYGGYIGVGKGYTETAKVVFSGNPSVLATLDTKVSSEFLIGAGESLDDYLARTSLLSGKTGIAQETMLGYSMERQLITPSQYVRKGVELPGSAYVSQGKVGTFQIQQKPSGLLGKIPIVSDLLSDYTNITVYKGAYVPTTKAVPTASLNVGAYNSTYGKTLSLSRLTTLPSVAPVILTPSVKSETKTITVKSSPVSSPISKPVSVGSLLNVPSSSKGSVPVDFSVGTVFSSPTSQSTSKGKSQRSSSQQINDLVNSTEKINSSFSSNISGFVSSPKSSPSKSRNKSSSIFGASVRSNSLLLPQDISPQNRKPTNLLPYKTFGTKLNVWKFPVLDPEEVLGLKIKRRRRK